MHQIRLLFLLPVEFTIMSVHAPDSTGFVWSKDGNVHSVNHNYGKNVMFLMSLL